MIKMRNSIVYLSLLLLYRNSDAADFDVEQVKSPQVELHDVGPMMESLDFEKSPRPNRSYGTHIPPSKLCSTCQMQHGGSYGGGSSWSSSSSYSSGVNPIHTQPSHYSSKHEYEKKQKFVNGQKVYDLHHEKEYKNGNLVKNERYEKTPDQLGVPSLPTHSYGYGGYEGGSSSSLHSGMNYSPSSYHTQSSYYKNSGTGSQLASNTDMDETLKLEMERLHNELRKNAYGQHQIYSPNYGSSHKSEYESEVKYVNGKPVYERKEERKYKDGKLIHNVAHETGKDDLESGENFYYPHTFSPSPSVESNSQFSSHVSQGSLPVNIDQRYSNTKNTQTKYVTSTGTNSQNRPAGLPHTYTPENQGSGYINYSNYSSKHRNINRNYDVPKNNHLPENTNEERITEVSDSSQINLYPDRLHHTGLLTSSGSQTQNQNRPYVHSTSYMKSKLNRTDTPLYYRRPYNIPSNIPQTGSSTDSHSAYQTNYHKTSSKYGTNEIKTDASNEEIESGVNQGMHTVNIYGNAQNNDKFDKPVSTYDNKHRTQINYESQRNYNNQPNKAYYPYATQNFVNSSRTNEGSFYHIPLSWVETKTIWEYVNGRLSGEKIYKKFYENGALVHENVTQRSRDEMSVDGINVQNLDLSIDELKSYGPVETSTTHTQKHEVHQVKRYRNGQPIYELNHERLYQDGNLVDENRQEKNERDFEVSQNLDYNRYPSQTQNVNRQYQHSHQNQNLNQPQTYNVNQHKQYQHSYQNQNLNQPQTHNVNQHKQYQHSYQNQNLNQPQTHNVNQHTQYQHSNQNYTQTINQPEQDQHIRQNSQHLYGNNEKQNQHSQHGTQQSQYNYERTSQKQYQNKPILTASGILHSTGHLQTANVIPRNISTKHEIREENQYVNGQKVYDLYHEKKYKNGHLAHENKNEYGSPHVGLNVGSKQVTHEGQMLTSQQTTSQQQNTATNKLHTSCLTCGHIHSRHESSNIHSKQHRPLQVHGGSSSFKQEFNVEEHYEDGKLVKGNEGFNKWVDGNLIDSRDEKYHSGPSRISQTSEHALGGFGTSSSQYSEQSASTGSFNKLVGTTSIRQSVKECSQNPCLNRGSCKARPTGPVCVCQFGFKGEICQEAYCPVRYCRYGGRCSIENDQHRCDCTEGYSGYRCSTRTQKVQIGVSG